MKPTTILIVFATILFSPNLYCQTTYNSQYIVNMENDIDLGIKYDFTTTNTLQQSFRLNMDDVNAYEANISHLFLYTYFWPGPDVVVTLNFYEGDVGNLGNLIHTQDLIRETLDVKIGFVSPEGSNTVPGVYPLTQNITLKTNRSYVVEFVLPNNGINYYGIYTTETDLGTCNVGNRDLWFKLFGEVESTTDTTINISKGNNSGYQLDTYSNFFADKLLNKYEPENLWIKTPLAGTLSFISSDDSIVKPTLNSQQVGIKDNIELMGLSVGEAIIYVLHQNDTISHFNVKVTDKKTINTSYQYFKYPGESNHNLLSAFESVSEKIGEIYEPVNVHIEFTDQGVIEYEWDLNGDGYYWTPSYIEANTAMDQTPNGTDFFTNFVLLRENKNDSYVGAANGGGISRGSSKTDAPPRYAFVALHLFDEASNLGETLAHEIGHNFGLSHYSNYNRNNIPVPNDTLNIMNVGHDDNLIYGFQWDVIHETINYRESLEETYDTRANAVFNNFNNQTFVFGEPNTDAQINASTNSDSEITYKLTSIDTNVISINNNGQITVLGEGEAEVTAYVYATNNYLAHSESITISISGPTYCSSQGNNPTEEYIYRFQLNTIDNASGIPSGYSDYTAISTDLQQGGQYLITVTPRWTGYVYYEAYAAWIDYNNDGDFMDSGELVFEQYPTADNIVGGTFTIPPYTRLGSTRIRVSMKYGGTPTSCEAFAYGEVEDYTVNITPQQQFWSRSTDDTDVIEGDDETRGDGSGSARVTLYPNPARDYLIVKLEGARMKDYIIMNLNGQIVMSGTLNNRKIDVSKLSSELYILEFKDGEKRVTQKFIKL